MNLLTNRSVEVFNTAIDIKREDIYVTHIATRGLKDDPAPSLIKLAEELNKYTAAFNVLGLVLEPTQLDLFVDVDALLRGPKAMYFIHLALPLEAKEFIEAAMKIQQQEAAAAARKTTIENAVKCL